MHKYRHKQTLSLPFPRTFRRRFIAASILESRIKRSHRRVERYTKGINTASGAASTSSRSKVASSTRWSTSRLTKGVRWSAKALFHRSAIVEAHRRSTCATAKAPSSAHAASRIEAAALFVRSSSESGFAVVCASRQIIADIACDKAAYL